MVTSTCTRFVVIRTTSPRACAGGALRGAEDGGVGVGPCAETEREWARARASKYKKRFISLRTPFYCARNCSPPRGYTYASVRDSSRSRGKERERGVPEIWSDIPNCGWDYWK